MNRRLFARAAGLFAFAAAPAVAASAARAEEAKPSRMVIHVGGNTPAEMNTALSFATNFVEHYAGLGQSVSMEIVSNGPGYLMMRDDLSPVKARIAEIHAKFPMIVFSACQNSRRGIAKAEGKTIEQIVEIPEAHDVPAGIVRLGELQAQGWSYVRG
jgi:intracellular sulfur oxidation DsrE/DsrF family protein